MKQILIQYAAYNYWANAVMLNKSAEIPAEILFKDTGSSFESIYKTFLHMLQVECVWWDRMKLKQYVPWEGADGKDDLEVLSKRWLQQSAEWNDFMKTTTEAYLTHVFSYYNTKKEYFKQPVYEMILHVFNHQTYHRGQIVTMMRQNGITKIPATDFSFFTRKK